MIVQLNGEEKTLTENLSVAKLLEELQMAVVRVAVEINGEVLSRNTLDDTVIKEGDRIEIVTFVGGG